MLKIKKYSNGRFFDTETKEYIKSETLAEMVKNGEEIQVILTRTGKDITDQVIEQLSKKEERKEEKKKKESPFLATDKLMKWVGEVIDTKIEKVMDIIKLPTREQVTHLEETVKELNDKIDALTMSQEKTATQTVVTPKDETKPVIEPPVDTKKTEIKKESEDKKKVAEKPVDTKKTETKESSGNKKTVVEEPATEKKSETKTKSGDEKKAVKQQKNDKKSKGVHGK